MTNLKSFNLNDYIYIQITESGWTHLRNTVGADYIKHCIKRPDSTFNIDGKDWYRLQAHEVFSILPTTSNYAILYNLTIMIDEKSLE